MPSEAPWAQQSGLYPAQEDRRLVARLPVQAGVVGDTDLKITPVSGLQVQPAAGAAWVAGSHAGVTRQGLYKANLTPVCPADCPTANTAHATLPRIDQVVFRIYDAVPGSGVAGDAQSVGLIEIVPGTATSGATLANRLGVGPMPASSLLLADLLVPAAFGGPFVQNTHIRDRRPRAWGLDMAIERTANAAAANDYTTASTTAALMDATNLQPRIEASGRPIIVELAANLSHSVAQAQTEFQLWLDGVSTGVSFYPDTAATAGRMIQPFVRFRATPAAGSHLVGLAWKTITAGTLTARARPTNERLYMFVRETWDHASNTGA